MKLSSALNLVGTLGAIIAALVLYVQLTRLKEETTWLKSCLAQTVVARELASSRPALPAQVASAPAPAPSAVTVPAAPSDENGEMELAGAMAKLQLHANKLYFAGTRQNWKLADFYVEEIEETAKEIARKNIMHGQINISGLMPALLIPEVEKLEATVARKDPAGFRENYTALTAACNACHTAARKAFIVIEDPRTPALDNQRYEPANNDE